MNSFPLVFVLGTAMLIATGSARAQIAPFTDDVWDVSRGSIVTSNSLTLASDVRDMFGFVNPASVEPGQVIFQDNQPQGFVHFVEWKSAVDDTVTGIQLIVAHDYTGDANLRGISEFSLYARNTETNLFDHLVFQYFPANPYSDSVAPPGGAIRITTYGSELLLCVTFESVTAREFRAEFVQYGSGINSGPRVLELDGFDEVRPRCFEKIFRSGFEAGEQSAPAP